jgi:hypothetical protein
MELAGNDGVVEIRLDVGVTGVLERHDPLTAEAHKIEEAIATGFAVGGFLEEFAEAILQLLLNLLPLLRAHGGELVAEKRRPESLDRFGGLDGHGWDLWVTWRADEEG